MGETMHALMSLTPPALDDCSRENLLQYFQNAWQLEDLLLRSLVGEETFYLNPDRLRNPLIFYLGHSAVFYINKLIRVDLLQQRINPTYEILFEIGVDPETPEELKSALQAVNWPEVSSVWAYRDRAYETITQLIETTPLPLPITPDSSLWALLMAIEHSRIHFETSSVLIRQLPLDRVDRPAPWHYAPTTGQIPENPLLPVSGGVVHLGKAYNSSTYGWDIEYGQRQVEVQPFLASQHLITNGEFLKFLQEGGYENPAYWEPEAWAWKVRYGVQHPKFWFLDRDQYRYRAMFDAMDLPLDWPVEVNYYEAMAFCRWQGQGFRLMGEGEWHLASAEAIEDHPPTDKPNLGFSFDHSGTSHSGTSHSGTNGYNLNLKFGSPSPVGSQATAKSKAGLYDLRGNVWEWLGDSFKPLPGFQPHPLYENYSAPFFDEKHHLMLGGAWASTGTYAARNCRNWFRQSFYQHAGFRLAQDLQDL
jgi:5-histidylcysteine sulfoxide synthase